MPKILVVAMTESVHTARWISELRDLGFDIHLFPSLDLSAHPSITGTTIHGFYVRPPKSANTFPGSIPCPHQKIAYYLNMGLQRMREHRLRTGGKDPDTVKVRQLVKVIKKIQPDIIHTLEMQHAGYVTLKAKEATGTSFPPWIYTPWGNDIYFFGRFPEHNGRIKAVLAACDYYAPKSERDIKLGRAYGFKGEVLPMLPGNGAFDTVKMRALWDAGKTSERKRIIVKGYQGIMGRSLVALHALELCSDALTGYAIDVYSASEDVRMKAHLVTQDTGLAISVLPPCSHEDMLRLYGRSRVSIGMSLSDGVSNSLLESMAMGAFPIESTTSCANEWVTDGRNGFIVPPEDPVRIAEKVRATVENDDLVDRAAAENFEIIRSRMDNAVFKPKVRALYDQVLGKQEGDVQ